MARKCDSPTFAPKNSGGAIPISVKECWPGVGRVRLRMKPQHLADGASVGIQGTFPEIEARDQDRRAVLIGISEQSASERVDVERP
jgi:hypothetical protein